MASGSCDLALYEGKHYFTTYVRRSMLSAVFESLPSVIFLAVAIFFLVIGVPIIISSVEVVVSATVIYSILIAVEYLYVFIHHFHHPHTPSAPAIVGDVVRPQREEDDEDEDDFNENGVPSLNSDF